jgi:hypothetical protein
MEGRRLMAAGLFGRRSLPNVEEIPSLDEYKAVIAKFQKGLGERRAEFSEEMAINDKNARRFIARNDQNVEAGWMIVTTTGSPDSIKIEGICTHSEPSIKKGVLKALVTRAINISLQSNLRGVVTLTNMSSDDGKAYSFLGFVPVEPGSKKMRLDPGAAPNEKWKESGSFSLSKSGRKIYHTELDSIG